MEKKDELKITLVQPDIVWEDIPQNLKNIETLLNNTENTDLIILPELFATGFTMNVSSLAEDMNGKIVSWMKNISKNRGCHVMGSTIIKDGGAIFNRALIIDSRGGVAFYDKRHLFSMGEEDRFYTQGKERLVFAMNGWKICPLICYDLRFPVWSRNRNEYDILIYIANWPAVRQKAWNNLLISRAIENQCFTVGVNRIGIDGKNIKYIGESKVVDARGNEILVAPKEQVFVDTIDLEYSDLKIFREKFPALKDGDQFVIEI